MLLGSQETMDVRRTITNQIMGERKRRFDSLYVNVLADPLDAYKIIVFTLI